MTDRERLDKMAKQAEEQRTKDLVARQEQDTARLQAEQDKAMEAKQKTNELHTFCDQTFKGFKLNPTGHEVGVCKARESILHDIPNDGTEYVVLYITHWGDETGGFQGQIPILLCRYHDGMYEIIVGTSKKQRHAANWEPFKEYLLRAVAIMGRDALGDIFKQVRIKLRA